MSHLWEVDHAYYCNQGNYYAPGSDQPVARYKSWAEFEEERGDGDLDMNLVFRWDWNEGEDHDLAAFNGDIYYRNGQLLLYYMGQRKGLYRWVEIEVCRADEDQVRAWLQVRFDYLMHLWAPLAPTTAEPQP